MQGSGHCGRATVQDPSDWWRAARPWAWVVGRTAGRRRADAEHREHIGLALAPHLVAATLLQFAATPSALLAVDHY